MSLTTAVADVLSNTNKIHVVMTESQFEELIRLLQKLGPTTESFEELVAD